MTHQQLFKPLAARITLSLAVAPLACSMATAQPLKLEPNPNGPDDTITIDVGEWVANWEVYLNQGTIDNSGQIDNSNNFTNEGTLDNSGDITNEWSISNEDTGTIYNRADGWLLNLGGIENSGIIDNSGRIDNVEYLSNAGTIDNRAGGTIDNYGLDNSGIINNSGTIYNEDMHNRDLGTINNMGNMFTFERLENSGIINNFGTFDNVYNLDNWTGGTLNNEGMLINEGWLDNWGTIDNSGTIDNTLGGTFTNYGTLRGTGTFIGDLINDGGVVAPGSSPGTMTIDGNFTLAGTGILDIEIGGLAPGLFDVLNVTGTADLTGGTVNISFLDGYDIITDLGPGETWDSEFLTAAGGIISFDSVINFTGPSYIDFDVVRHGDDWVFEATNVVPIPPAVLLGGIGLALSGWKLRRREES